MNNKKRYIIAIALFLFLGLGIFAFAGTEDELLDDGNGNGNGSEVTPGDKENDTSDNVIEPDENDNESTGNSSNRGNSSSNKNTTTQNRVNYYQLALEAVINSEKNYVDEDAYNKAVDAVEDLNDSDSRKEELLDRLEDVKTGIDLSKLVDELVKMVNDSTNKDELDLARVFHTNEEEGKTISELVGELTNEELKEALNNALNVVMPLLNDTTAPVIEGLKDGDVKQSVTINVTDENEVKIYLTKNDEEETEIENLSEIATEGNYVLRVVDSAFNEIIINFIIDRTAATIDGIDETEYTYDGVGVTPTTNATDVNSVVLTKDGIVVENYTLGTAIVNAGSYKLVVTDEAGNETIVEFVINKKQLEFELSVENEYEYAGEEIKATVKVTNAESSDVYEIDERYYIMNEKGQFVGPLKVDYAKDLGEYKVKVVVKSINENYSDSETKELRFKIVDTTPATITTPGTQERFDKILRVEAGTVVTLEEVLATVTDNYDKESKLAPYKADLLIGTKEENVYNYDFSNGFNTAYVSGRYNLYYTYTDNSGNVSTASMIISFKDTTPATINIPGTVGLNKNEYIIEAGSEVKLEDLMATVTDNVDEESKLAPYKANLLISNIASENKYNYDFSNGFETNYHGRYQLYYKYTDKAGHVTTKSMLLVMKDRIAPTLEITSNGNIVYVRGKDVTRLKYNVIKDGKTVHTVDSATCNCGNYFSITWLAKQYGDGMYTIEVVDAGGNKAVAEAKVDTTKPVLSIKEESVGNGTVYSKISFKLYDSNSIDYFTINGVKHDRSNNQWSDANFDNIKNNLVEGENEIVLYDVVGNSSSLKFVIDWTKPEVTNMVQKYESKENGRIRVTLTFSEPIREPLGQGWLKVSGQENTYSKVYYSQKEYNVSFMDLAGNENTYSFVVDRTPNRVTQTFYRGQNTVGKVNYIKNGEKVQFNIGFRDKLSEDAVITIGGKEVALSYDKFYAATNSHMYYGYLTIAENESEMVEGDLEIVISNITDSIGNPGFYYQTNGTKVISSYKNVITTNGEKVVYDRTAPVVEAQYRPNTTNKITDIVGSDANNIVFEIYKDGKRVHKVDQNVNYKRFSIDWLGDGEYKVVVTDIAGNVTTVNATIDHTAPEVTPSYTEKTVEGDRTKEFTDFPTFEITDLTEVTTKLESGSVDMSKVGTYTLTYSFTDEFNNVTTKEINVNVVDTTAATIEIPYTEGKNKNEMIVTPGTRVTLEDVMAVVTDNIDGVSKLAPYKADLLISNKPSENIYNYDFSNGFDTNYQGRYNLYYKYEDKAGNVVTAGMMIMIKDKTAPTYKFYKLGSSLPKDEIEPVVIDGVNYFDQPVRVVFTDNVYFKQYVHNDFVNNEDKITVKSWTREAKTVGEHTMSVKDAGGNTVSTTFVVRAPKEVTTISELKSAIAEGYDIIKVMNTLDVEGDQKVTSEHDILLTSDEKITMFNVPEGQSLTLENIILDGENNYKVNVGNYVNTGNDPFAIFDGHVTEMTRIYQNVPLIKTKGELVMGKGSVIKNYAHQPVNQYGSPQQYGGPAILATAGKVTINGLEFTNNVSQLLTASNTNVVVSDVNVNNNWATGNKAALIEINANATMDFNNGTIKNNMMSMRSYGLFIANAGVININGGTIKNNYSTKNGSNTAGSLIGVETNGKIYMNDGTIENNIGYRAGAFATRWANEDSIIEFNGGIVKNNKTRNTDFKNAGVFVQSKVVINKDMEIDDKVVIRGGTLENNGTIDANVVVLSGSLVNKGIISSLDLTNITDYSNINLPEGNVTGKIDTTKWGKLTQEEFLALINDKTINTPTPVEEVTTIEEGSEDFIVVRGDWMDSVFNKKIKLTYEFDENVSLVKVNYLNTSAGEGYNTNQTVTADKVYGLKQSGNKFEIEYNYAQLFEMMDENSTKYIQGSDAELVFEDKAGNQITVKLEDKTIYPLVIIR